MMEAVLEVEARCPLLVGPARDGRISFRVVDRRKVGHSSSQDLLEIAGARAQVDTFLGDLQARRTAEIADLMQLGPDRALALLTIPSCRAACEAVGDNAFLVAQETNGRGTYRWRLLLADSESLDAVMADLRRMRCDLRLVRVRRLRPSEILSSRQETIIRVAWQLGYYAFPRKIRLTQLAGRLGMSKAALSQVLRRGEEKIVARHFEGFADRH
jgi:predicted DNA binding protein